MKNCSAPPPDRRPNVGILTGSFHTEYSRQIATAVCDALSAARVNLILFQGLDASRFLDLGDYVDRGFDRHYYSQYEYSRFLALDVLVVSIGTISAVPDPMPLLELLRHLPQVPVVLLEDETPIPNGVHITVDNYLGMRSCVEHLIQHHGCKRLLYLSGPQGIEDADMRLYAYLDTLREHGLPIEKGMMAYGDFTDEVDSTVAALLDRYPLADALICANDEMAESAYRVLLRRGLVPGRDIAVTGFDNNPSSAYMGPALTTVEQGYRQVAEGVARTVLAYLRGEQPESVRLTAQLVVRQSCGCAGGGPVGQWAPRERQDGAVMRYRLQNKKLIRDNMLSALMLRNLLQEDITIHSFFHSMGTLLHALGTDHAWIGLLREPMTVPEGERMFLPKQMRLHMVLEGEEIRSYSRLQAPILRMDSRENLPVWDSPGSRPTAIFPLFYGPVHYGVMAVSLTHESMLLHYALSLEIGTGLRYLFMALDQQEARRDLEEKNKILDYSASHDALTGLYNRVGAMNQIYTFVHTHGKDARFVAVMADLDHLKQINDTFGHDAGDVAIQSATRMLHMTLPPGSPLGRTGGDEFTALFLQQDGHDGTWFREALRRSCDAFNRESSLPYYVSLSAGCISFRADQVGDLPRLYRQADEALYEDKKFRRTNVIRDL